VSVLVIGAGPAGLALAASLQRRGVPFDLVDRRGEVGGAWAQVYAGMTIFSPARYTSLPGLALSCPNPYVTAGEYHEYLVQYAKHYALQPRQAEVTWIERQHRSFAVTFRNESPRSYRAVVVATGMFDFPRWPNIPGLPSHAVERDDFVLVG
jgi:putative flavoprotein involved in K+ transport